MRLTVLGSGSSGNGYVLEARTSALILECGVPPKVLHKLVSFPTSKIAGCLVSHEHIDHAKYAESYAKMGIRIFASAGTCRAIDERKEKAGRYFPSWTLRPLMPLSTTLIGEWKVRTFDVVHDAEEPFGFIIEHRECGRILFITDTSFCKYNFRDLAPDHIMVEANYDDGILNQNVVQGTVEQPRAERTRRSHMSIRQACDLIRANQTAELKTVLLMHLSQDNADPALFVQKAEETALFARVLAAGRGLVVYMNKNENLAVL